MILAVLDHALHADNTRVDRGNPLSLSPPSATGLSALAPAERAGAQRLCALAPNGHAKVTGRCPISGYGRTWFGRAARSAFGPDSDILGPARPDKAWLRRLGVDLGFPRNPGACFKGAVRA